MSTLLLAYTVFTPSLVARPYMGPPQAASSPVRVQSPLRLQMDVDFSSLAGKLDAVKAMEPAEVDGEAQQALWQLSGRRDPAYKVSGLMTQEPTFTRLFTHETWNAYTGRRLLARWWKTSITWRYSTILRSVLPVSIITAAWAYMIAGLPGVLLPRTSPVPMSLLGTALGLLLVFRTNNSYQRLSEAREYWSQLIAHVRDIGHTVAMALVYDKRAPAAARDGAARICCYLAAFAWELRGQLTGGGIAEDTRVLDALLPAEEAAWIASQRSRPAQLLVSLRVELYEQFQLGHLPAHLHRKIEEDTRSLNLILGGCVRLFSSPLPPTMSRHIVRCLQLFFIGLPFVLAGTMAPLTVAAWVFVVSYAFVGIDEVGVQVEQPFEVLPMTKLCNVVMANLDELFVTGTAAHQRGGAR